MLIPWQIHNPIMQFKSKCWVNLNLDLFDYWLDSKHTNLNCHHQWNHSCINVFDAHQQISPSITEFNTDPSDNYWYNVMQWKWPENWIARRYATLRRKYVHDCINRSREIQGHVYNDESIPVVDAFLKKRAVIPESADQWLLEWTGRTGINIFNRIAKWANSINQLIN
jgi:hypothetical protein